MFKKVKKSGDDAQRLCSERAVGCGKKRQKRAFFSPHTGAAQIGPLSPTTALSCHHQPPTPSPTPYHRPQKCCEHSSEEHTFTSPGSASPIARLPKVRHPLIPSNLDSFYLHPPFLLPPCTTNRNAHTTPSPSSTFQHRLLFRPFPKSFRLRSPFPPRETSTIFITVAVAVAAGRWEWNVG